MTDKIFVDGVFFNPPREGAPDFVKGSLSVEPKRLIEFMSQNVQYRSDKGFFKFDILKSQKDTYYLAVNTWKPEKKEERGEIPF